MGGRGGFALPLCHRPRGPGSGLCAGLAGAGRAESSPFLPKTPPQRLPRGFLRSRTAPRPGCPGTMCLRAPSCWGQGEHPLGPLPVPSASSLPFPAGNWDKLGQTGPRGGPGPACCWQQAARSLPARVGARPAACRPLAASRRDRHRRLLPLPAAGGGPGGDFSSSTPILRFFSPALLRWRLLSPCPSSAGGLPVVPPPSPACPPPLLTADPGTPWCNFCDFCIF